MSRIADLGSGYKNLPALIAEYEAEIDAAPERLTLKGKTLAEALKEQCSWPMFYEVRKAEVKTLVKYIEAQVEKVRGQLGRRYKDNLSLDVGERMLNSFINSEAEYLKVNELRLEVEELYEKYSAMDKAFDKRGFALRDMTTAKVNQLHDLPI